MTLTVGKLYPAVRTGLSGTDPLYLAHGCCDLDGSGNLKVGSLYPCHPLGLSGTDPLYLAGCNKPDGSGNLVTNKLYPSARDGLSGTDPLVLAHAADACVTDSDCPVSCCPGAPAIPSRLYLSWDRIHLTATTSNYSIDEDITLTPNPAALDFSTAGTCAPSAVANLTDSRACVHTNPVTGAVTYGGWQFACIVDPRNTGAGSGACKVRNISFQWVPADTGASAQCPQGQAPEPTPLTGTLFFSDHAITSGDCGPPWDIALGDLTGSAGWRDSFGEWGGYTVNIYNLRVTE